MFSGIVVFSPQLLMHWISVFWQNLQTHAAPYIDFFKIPDFMQSLSEKHFRTAWQIQGVSPAKTSEF